VQTDKAITPVQVEKRLVALGVEIDDAQSFLESSEMEYFTAKTDCELSLAGERIALSKSGLKFTVQEKEDIALTACADKYRRLGEAEAKVRAARSNVQRIRAHIDIVRSVGTSVRASMEV
jgi:hypothetical protein